MDGLSLGRELHYPDLGERQLQTPYKLPLKAQLSGHSIAYFAWPWRSLRSGMEDGNLLAEQSK